MNPDCSPPRRWILDTHVALDWLLFDDPRTRFLAPALAAGAAQWLATPSMRREFELVLARNVFDRFSPDRARIADAWHRQARIVEEPAPSRWRCRDPDDQVFLDLAVAHGASTLFTRDKALRVLAPKLRGCGVAVLPPEVWWSRQQAAGTEASSD
jgi:predicted nucleic acid-binding protein